MAPISTRPSVLFMTTPARYRTSPTDNSKKPIRFSANSRAWVESESCSPTAAPSSPMSSRSSAGWISREVGRVEQEERKLTVVSPPPVAPVAQNRWALVIGNSAYGTDIGLLPNPVNDATDMAATLQLLGFKVTLVLNATRQQMEEALAAFRYQLRREASASSTLLGTGRKSRGRII